MNIKQVSENKTVRWATLIAALIALPNLGKGWESLRYVTDAVPTAYAGQQEATKVRSDFDRYIEQREEEVKLEKQRIQLQEEYNKKLTELQQQQIQQQVQQMPMQQYANQAYQAYQQAYQAPQIQTYWDDWMQWFYCYDGYETWWANEEGYC